MSVNGYWYRIDEQRFAVATAKHALRCLNELKADSEQFPWAIIALHGATQAAMITNLTGTAGIGALDQATANQTLSAIHGEAEYPKAAYVAPFLELLRRTRKAERRLEQAGSLIEMSRANLRALGLLNSLRNDFVHFSPRGWSVEISGLPRIIEACVSILRAVCSSGWLIHLEAEEIEEYGVVIGAIEASGRTIFE